MAISYVGGKGAGTAGQGGGSITLTTGLTGGSGGAPIEGDLVVVTVSIGTAARAPTTAISTPTGYTPLTAQRTTATTYDTNVQTCYKVMGSTPDTAVTIPPSGNNADGIAYTIQVFRGVDPTTPMDATPNYATGSGVDSRPNPAAITPVTAGAWIVVCGGGAAATGAVYTAGYLTNLLTYNGPDTNDGTVGSGYYTGWTSGAYDPAVFGGGSVNAANSWGATTLALRPLTLVERIGDLAATETGSDTAAGSGDVVVQGDAAATETGSDSFAADGVVTDPAITGDLSVGEVGSDTATGSGVVVVQGTSAVTESGTDTAAIVGDVFIAGTLAVTEAGADTAAITGDVIVAGEMAASESGQDGAALSGAVLVSGDLAVTESGIDAALISGGVLLQGALSATESGADTFTANGGAEIGPITGAMAATESAVDSLTADGKVFVSGAASLLESGADQSSIEGQIFIAGGFAAFESGNDSASASGQVIVTGAISIQETGDDVFLATSDAPVQFPLAGITQSFPMAGIARQYPMSSSSKEMPLNGQIQSWPNSGRNQNFPLG